MGKFQELCKGNCALKIREFWKKKNVRIIAFLLALYLIPSGCSNMTAFKLMKYDQKTGRHLDHEYISPNGKYIASVHRDSGGLLGDWSTYVVLRSTEYPFLKRCVYKVRHSPACSVSWSDDSKLYVEGTHIYPIGIWVHSSIGKGHL